MREAFRTSKGLYEFVVADPARDGGSRSSSTTRVPSPEGYLQPIQSGLIDDRYGENRCYG